MFIKALMVRVVGALQLHQLYPDLKVPHLYFEIVVLIEIWSPPLLVRFFIVSLSSSSLAIWLSRTSVGILGCMKDVFRPFLVMKVKTVFDFLLALNTKGSHESKSAIASGLTLRPNKSSTGVFLLVFELLRCVIIALYRNAANDTIILGLHAWSARFTV